MFQHTDIPPGARQFKVSFSFLVSKRQKEESDIHTRARISKHVIPLSNSEITGSTTKESSFPSRPFLREKEYHVSLYFWRQHWDQVFGEPHL